MNCSDTGSGLPVIFVPGLVGSKEWFRYQDSGLSDSYRIISYDLRRVRGRVEYTLDLLVDDLAKFLNALRIPAAAIAGHDFGALIALKFALTYPNRCLALTTISSAPSFSAMSEEEILESFSPGEIKFEGFWERLWKRLFAKKSLQDEEPGSLGYLPKHSGNIDQQTLSARLELARNTDLTEELHEVCMPTMIMVGSKDKPEILAGAQILDEQIPDSTLEVVEDADHFLFYTRHDLFNAALDEFLRRNAVYF